MRSLICVTVLCTAVMAQSPQGGPAKTPSPGATSIEIHSSGAYATNIGVNNGTVINQKMPKPLSDLVQREIEENKELKAKLEKAEATNQAVQAAYNELRISVAAKVGLSDIEATQLGKLIDAGKLDEAIALNAALLSDQAEKTAAANHRQALLYELKLEPELALPYHKAAYEAAKEDPEYAITYAGAMVQSKDCKSALPIFTDAVARLKEKADRDDETYAYLYNALSGATQCYLILQRFDEWKEANWQAADLYVRIVQAKPRQFSPAMTIFAQTQLEIAELFRSNLDTDDATFANVWTKGWKSILEAYTPMAKTKPETFEPIAALAHEALGVIDLNLEKQSEAEKEFAQAVELLSRVLARGSQVIQVDGMNLDPPDQLSNTQALLGDLYGEDGHPQLGEPLIIEALGRLRGLATNGSRAYQEDYADAVEGLGECYFREKRYAESLGYAQQAAKMYAELRQRGPPVLKVQIFAQTTTVSFQFNRGRDPDLDHALALMLSYNDSAALKESAGVACEYLNEAWKVVRETGNRGAATEVTELTTDAVASGTCAGEGARSLTEPAIYPAVANWVHTECVLRLPSCKSVGTITRRIYDLRPDPGSPVSKDEQAQFDLNIFEIRAYYGPPDCELLDQALSYASDMSLREHIAGVSASAVQEGKCSPDELPTLKKLNGAAKDRTGTGASLTGVTPP